MAEPVSEDPPTVLPPEPLTDPFPGQVVTGIEYGPSTSAPAGPLDDAPPAARQAWTVGTLTYTTGTLITLFAVLLGGDLALQLRERSVGPIVQQMIKRLTPSDLLMAVLVSTLPTALTLLILPVVSYKSDRHRGRWGRRIPYLLAPTPFAVAAMVLLAYSEDFGRWISAAGPDRGSAATWGLVCFGTSWTVFEVAVLVAGPMVGALINDVVPRPVLGRFYGLFRAVSLIAGIGFNTLIYKHAEQHYRVILVSIAVVFGCGLTAMCLGVREGEYPPPASAAAGRSLLRLWATSLVYVKDAFSVGYYRWVFAAFMLASLTFQPVNLFAIPYTKSIGMSDAAFGNLMGATYTCSLILAWPLGWLVDRAHALRVSLLMMAMYAVAMLLAGLFVHDARTFGVFFFAHVVLSGCYFTTSAPLGQVLFPRINYAQYGAAAGVVQAVVMLGFGPALGKSLDWSGHRYHLTFWISDALATACVVSLLVVYGRFNRLGGRRAYVAPGEAEPERPQGFEVVRGGH